MVDATTPPELVSFIYGGNTGLTYDQLQRRRAVALAMAAKQRGYPKNIGEGLTALGDALGENMYEERLRQQEAAYAADRAQQLNAPANAPSPAKTSANDTDAGPAFAGTSAASPPYSTPPPATAAAPAGAPTASIDDNDLRARIAALLTPGGAQANPTSQAAGILGGPSPDVTETPAVLARRNAIAGLESGGRRDPYQTVGVATAGDRPYGRYGVMGANIGPWTQEVLGQRMTPQQFMANPQAQNDVFDTKMAGYAQDYGEEGAARAWLGGPGSVKRPGNRDVLGTSVGDYGQRYMAALGRGGAPVRLASRGDTGASMTDVIPTIPLGGNTEMNADQPTPVDIKPATATPNTMLAQAIGASAVPGASSGIPGPLAQPTPFKPAPIESYIPNLDVARMRGEPPQPTPTPMTEAEIRGIRAMQLYPSDPDVQAYAKRLIDFGQAQRKAADDRNVEEYKLKYSLWEKQTLAEQQAVREQPKAQADLRREAEAAAKARRDEEKQTRLGGIPEATWQKNLEESAKSMEPVVAAAASIPKMRANLESGKMFTGLLGPAELTGAKLLRAIGLPENPGIEPTEQFASLIAPIVAAARKSLAGTANISDKDLAAAQSAAAGKITLEPSTMMAVLKAVEQMNLNLATIHQRKLLTYAGNDPDAQRGAFGLYGLPMEQIVPDKYVQKLRDNAENPQAAKDFDTKFHTPGLAARILESRGR